jgi:hypothetical protein
MVWPDMVNHFSRSTAVLLQAHHAQRLHTQVQLPHPVAIDSQVRRSTPMSPK